MGKDFASVLVGEESVEMFDDERRHFDLDAFVGFGGGKTKGLSHDREFVIVIDCFLVHTHDCTHMGGYLSSDWVWGMFGFVNNK